MFFFLIVLTNNTLPGRANSIELGRGSQCWRRCRSICASATKRRPLRYPVREGFCYGPPNALKKTTNM